MAGDGDGSFPAAHGRLDAGQRDGRAEDGAVEHRADGAVGALPHLVEVIFVHALEVRGDRGALHGHAQALVGLGGVERHLVGGGVAVGQSQVIIFGLEVDEGQDELILDHLPQHTGHLIAVHLNERRRHLDFLCHGFCVCFCGVHVFVVWPAAHFSASLR